MIKARLCSIATVMSTMIAVSLISATAASAAESDADSIVALLESLPTEIPVMQDVSTAGATDLVTPGTSSNDDAAIEEASKVSVSALGENPLSVELLSAQDAESVGVSLGGVEVIDNGDDSSTVPLVRDDGSLQIVFTAETPNAPTNYAVDVGLPDGVELTQDEGGALLAMDASGDLVLGVAPAWAYDAAGTAVPTHYVIEGSTITQVVDHTSGEYEYPISADPYLGTRLFSPMTVNRSGQIRGKNVYSGRLTAWGIAMGLSPNGLVIMSTAGLAEFTSQWTTVKNSTSLKQQYLCHAAWGRGLIGAGVHWDLELFRPANARYLNVAAHQCNWT
jgi:hypothetical protein